MYVCVCQQFKHVPLYLEWMPVGIFNSPEPAKSKETRTHGDKVGCVTKAQFPLPELTARVNGLS